MVEIVWLSSDENATQRVWYTNTMYVYHPSARKERIVWMWEYIRHQSNKSLTHIILWMIWLNRQNRLGAPKATVLCLFWCFFYSSFLLCHTLFSHLVAETAFCHLMGKNLRIEWNLCVFVRIEIRCMYVHYKYYLLWISGGLCSALKFFTG